MDGRNPGETSVLSAQKAQKYLLTAYNISRAHNVVDHKLLKLRLLELGLPLCLVRWVWGWLRDRRVLVEVHGALSKDRIFLRVFHKAASCPPVVSVMGGWTG